MKMLYWQWMRTCHLPCSIQTLIPRNQHMLESWRPPYGVQVLLCWSDTRTITTLPSGYPSEAGFSFLFQSVIPGEFAEAPRAVLRPLAPSNLFFCPFIIFRSDSCSFPVFSNFWAKAWQGAGAGLGWRGQYDQAYQGSLCYTRGITLD